MIAPSILTARRHGLIVAPDMLPSGDGININGPSLIGMPDWAPGRLSAYYLYFADHGGSHILSLIHI